MIPPKCDPACHDRRLRMYILYIGILVICLFLALCHFIISFLGRRKVKEEARDYLARRQSAISYFSTEQLHPNPVYNSVHQDNITITTDGSTAITIEMPDDDDSDNSSSPSNKPPYNSDNYNNKSTTGSASSTQRPLQKIPEELEEGGSESGTNKKVNGGGGGITVAVDVHAEDSEHFNHAVHNHSSSGSSNDKKRRGSFVANHIHSHAKSIFFPRSGRANCVTPTPLESLGATNVKEMMTNGPMAVAVATVSAIVAQATYTQNQTQQQQLYDSNNLSSDSTFGIGNISRPNSATSCFDISDIVESPEMPRKKVVISKSKTC